MVKWVVFALSVIFAKTLKGSRVFVKKSTNYIFLLEKVKKNMALGNSSTSVDQKF